MKDIQTVRYTVDPARENNFHEIYNNGYSLPFDWFTVNQTRDDRIRKKSARNCIEYTKDNTVIELITGLRKNGIDGIFSR